MITGSHWKGYPDSKVHGANMGPTWGRQDPAGPHVSPMNLAIWVANKRLQYLSLTFLKPEINVSDKFAESK